MGECSFIYLFNENSRSVFTSRDFMSLDTCIFKALTDLDIWCGYTVAKPSVNTSKPISSFFDLFFVDLVSYKAVCLFHVFFSYDFESKKLCFSGKYKESGNSRPQVFKDFFVLNTDRFAYQDNVKFISNVIGNAPFLRKDHK